ncbi:MAG: hypothetical protein M0R76_03095 [Proteobacteria bacterium]|nr:hypothetical protein [Pseudomonadota bacterium]
MTPEKKAAFLFYKSTLVVLLSPLLVTLLAAPLHAADTTETWDVGATNTELYVGIEEVGKSRSELTLYSDMLLGYGIIERFSAYFGSTFFSNPSFTEGSADLFMGVFGTPLDTDHIDLDLFLDMRVTGADQWAPTVTPSLELNYDLKPDQALWGMYVRAGVSLYGRTDEDVVKKKGPMVDLAATLGTYWTFLERHRLLLEYDFCHRLRPTMGGSATEQGGLAIGYNVEVSDAIKLLNEIYIALPQSGESVSANFMVGIGATLPTAKTSAN